MSFVLDTSVTMTWCFEDEALPATDQLLTEAASGGAVVPAIWQCGVVNVLLVAQRKNRLSEAQADHFLSLVTRLPIRAEPMVTPSDVLNVGRRHGLSGYDAAYLELAGRNGWGLATLDSKLAAAARASGVELIL